MFTSRLCDGPEVVISPGDSDDMQRFATAVAVFIHGHGDLVGHVLGHMICTVKVGVQAAGCYSLWWVQTGGGRGGQGGGVGFVFLQWLVYI